MRVKQGPYLSAKTITANAVISAKPAVVANYTVMNASGAPVTVTFCDDVSTGGTDDFESVVVAAGVSVSLPLFLDTIKGLVVKCSLWTSVTVYTRWAPR